MILHCKNAEMTTVLSFLHFYSLKSYNFFQKNNKNCMILHCKNAEMTILIGPQREKMSLQTFF